MNTYKMAPVDVTKGLRRLIKKHHPMLLKARVRFEAMMVETDAEDGSPLRYAGTPASCVTKIVGQVDRVGSKCDVRILIDEQDWKNCTVPQQAAMLDRALQFIHVKQKDEKIQTDGNGRPKLGLRKPDRVFAWFDAIASRHGEASLEVQEAKQIVANCTTYLPGFDFLAKGESRPAPAKGTAIVIKGEFTTAKAAGQAIASAAEAVAAK